MYTNIFDRLSFLSLFLVVVLLPVFFLPFTKIPIEISKGLLLVMGLTLCIIFWAIARFFDGKISLPKSVCLLGGGGVVLIFFLSAFFSKASQVSFFGTAFDIGSFWFIFSAFLLMFCSSIIFRNSRQAKIVLFGAILSSAFVLVFQSIHLFFPKALSLGIFDVADKTANILGSWNALGLFAGFSGLLFLLVVEFFPISKTEKIILQIFILLSMLLVASINFLLVWILLGISSLIIFVYKASNTFKRNETGEGGEKTESDKKHFPAVSFVVVIISLLFLLNPLVPIIPGMSPDYLDNIIPTRLQISSNEISPSFSSTMVVTKSVLKEKPILGWGPENFAIGFDKYYDSALPYLTKNPNEWWDRAHNIFLDLSVCNGLLFCIIYFLMFGILFYKLFKNRRENTEDKISAHAILSTFLGYFTTLLFGFDSVSTYILFFFIVGYSLYLTSSGAADSTLSENQRSNQRNFSEKTFKHRKIIITTLLIILIIFLWQYNLKPLFINSEINKTEKMECEKKLNTLEKLFTEKSFLDAYLRLKYVEDAKACIEINPSKEAEYIDTSIKALKYAADVRPLYTRTWIMLGSFNTVLFANETDPQLKKNLYEEINYDFNKALSLGPKHQKILSEWAKFYFAAGDYEKMKSLSEECAVQNPDTNSCYWYLGLSEIALGDEKNGSENLKIAKEKGFSYNTQSAYSQLAIVYTQTKNYKELVPVYIALVTIDYKNIQYHATLAFVYQKLGNYKMARQEALEILKFAPEAKDEVNAFLRTLPLN